MRSRLFFLPPIVFAAGFAGCETARDSEEAPPSYATASTVLEARCLRCHAGSAPAGGWRADSYIAAIGCNAENEPVLPRISSILDRPEHKPEAIGLTTVERSLLERWAGKGGPRNAQSLHGPSFADPRSPASHGNLLRAAHYKPMLDPADANACGACHAGAPRLGSESNSKITLPATTAPTCTSCHSEPEGALACTTCHGNDDQLSSSSASSNARHAYPPRSRCFFPDDRADSAHRAHVEPNSLREQGLPCSTCHPQPANGEHSNGHVEVWFDYNVAGREARIEQNASCASTSCHSRGGTRPTPSWMGALAAPMTTCNECHASPPKDHYRGACTTCHHEANESGTALTRAALHVNGKVDLGDGSGQCGACHGTSSDPTLAALAWPSSGAHAAHANPSSSKPVACETCHVVPDGSSQKHPDPTRLSGAAEIRLSGLATRGGRRPSFDSATKTCSGTYCHEGSGAAKPSPQWTTPLPTTTTDCGSCHGAPPPPPHVQVAASAGCSGSTCHDGATKSVHVDGKIDH